jgi:hypothetical protein
MDKMRWQDAEHLRDLVVGLGSPTACATLDEGRWDLVVRAARSARLLGVLAHRIEQADVTREIPSRVVAHLQAALSESRYLRQMALRQLDAVGATLRPLGARMIALKGCAYVLQRSKCADGRLLRDVDIMVERERLGDVERALLDAGWSFEKTDPYDQRYYREWSHELPPMQAPGMPLELDLHHAILPPLGRIRPDPRLLFEESILVGDGPWSTLGPLDQILHGVVHLLQDAEWSGGLRDLVDFDCLVREGSIRPDFWPALAQRATTLGVTRPLWYMLELAEKWLGTPVGIDSAARAAMAPSPATSAMILALADRCFRGVHPDQMPRWADRLAASAVTLRSAWFRMPPSLFAYHALARVWRRVPPSAKASH